MDEWMKTSILSDMDEQEITVFTNANKGKPDISLQNGSDSRLLPENVGKIMSLTRFHLLHYSKRDFYERNEKIMLV